MSHVSGDQRGPGLFLHPAQKAAKAAYSKRERAELRELAAEVY